MKVKLLKKLRKKSRKLQLIRNLDYQYIVTDNPAQPHKPRIHTYVSGTYYTGDSLIFDDSIVKWLHKCRREWILSQVRRMRRMYGKYKTIRIYKD